MHGFFASLSMTEEERGVRRHSTFQVSVERRDAELGMVHKQECGEYSL